MPSKSYKKIWDTITLMYEDSTKVKHNKLSLTIRPLINALQTSKNLYQEELVRILKFHKLKLQQDIQMKKENFSPKMNYNIKSILPPKS